MCGGSQSFNVVNTLRKLARWMRMPCVTNQVPSLFCDYVNSKRTHSMERERILWKENTFYSKRCPVSRTRCRLSSVIMSVSAAVCYVLECLRCARVPLNPHNTYCLRCARVPLNPHNTVHSHKTSFQGPDTTATRTAFLKKNGMKKISERICFSPFPSPPLRAQCPRLGKNSTAAAA